MIHYPYRLKWCSSTRFTCEVVPFLREIRTRILFVFESNKSFI